MEPVTGDRWPTTHDMWHLTHVDSLAAVVSLRDRLLLKFDQWQVTSECDMWHLTLDTWHLTHLIEFWKIYFLPVLMVSVCFGIDATIQHVQIFSVSVSVYCLDKEKNGPKNISMSIKKTCLTNKCIVRIFLHLALGVFSFICWCNFCWRILGPDLG